MKSVIQLRKCIVKHLDYIRNQIAPFLPHLRQYPFFLLLIAVLIIVEECMNLMNEHPCLIICEAVGLVFLTVSLLFVLVVVEKPDSYFNKFFVTALLWFVSCLVLVDFSQFSITLFFKIFIAFVYILLGCLYPDFIEIINIYKDRKTKLHSDENNNPYAILEKQIGEQSDV